jgi:hypothetical protein
VVHLAIVLSVFLLFMTCGSYGNCIFCLSSIHDCGSFGHWIICFYSNRGLWFIWPLYYLSFFYSWLVVHLAIALSVFLLFMTCGSFGHWIICYLFSSWIKERQIIQWSNEPQVMNKRKTDNTMVKWTTRHE